MGAVIDHLRESKKDKLPLGGGEDYTSPASSRFNVGGLVRFKGMVRGVDDRTVIAKFYARGVWFYWVASPQARIPCTYFEPQLESAE